MKKEPFSPTLLRAAQEPPGPLQMCAVTAMQLWALLGAARAEAEMRRDDTLSFRLSMLESMLAMPDREDA
jgi:hypothetical protein